MRFAARVSCVTNSMSGGSSESATIQQGPGDGRRCFSDQSARDWIVRDVPDLRIVNDDLWDRVQTRLGAIRNSDGSDKGARDEILGPAADPNIFSRKAFAGFAAVQPRRSARTI